MNKPTCTMPECDRKILARGLCPTHYSSWHRANKGRTYRMHARECCFCGAQFETSTPATRFCSLECGQRDRAGWSKSKVLARRTRLRFWVGHTLSPREGEAMVAGQCAYCPTYFVGLPGSLYCSGRCQANAKLKRRYDLRGDFLVSDRVRLAIYERDGFACQICLDPVDVTLHYLDRMAPTLDHIIPQSHMLIPDHSESNLRLAHRCCNSRRGNRAEVGGNTRGLPVLAPPA
jgi:5-methylcytosine-specific restriction endonuclease McrA